MTQVSRGARRGSLLLTSERAASANIGDEVAFGGRWQAALRFTDIARPVCSFAVGSLGHDCLHGRRTLLLILARWRSYALLSQEPRDIT